MKQRIRAICVALLATGALSALAASPAAASFSVASFSVSPTTTEAGAHPTVTQRLTFGGDEDVRDLKVSLPAGLVGNPQAAPHCSAAQFNSDTCPASSAVGSVSVDATALGFLPLTGVAGTVYLLDPRGTEPVDLGVIVRPGIANNIYLVAPITLRVPGDAGLDATISNIPDTATALGFLPTPLHTTAMTLTLNGTLGSGAAFMTNPTSCAPESASVVADSYGTSPPASASTPYQATGCSSVPFTPSTTTTLSPPARDTPTALAATLSLPSGGTGTAQSAIRNVNLTLPQGVALNSGVASAGLTGCTDAQLNVASAAAAGCPASSQIGTASFVTPLLPPVSGSVFIAAPTAANPYRIFVDLAAPGAHVKLVGIVTLDPATGQVNTVFSNLPQIPLTSFTLSFRGGDQAVFVTPQSCGSFTTTSSLTPWSGGADAHPSSATAVSEDGHGAPCPNPPPFRPALSGGVTSTQAGASTALSLTITRPDRDARPASLSLTLPPGLGARLSGVPFCSRAQAQANACSPSTRLGDVQATVGVGNGTIQISGGIFLTTPDPGAPAALAIVLPAAVGPFDLGAAVTIADIGVNPASGAISQTAALPTIIGGIPLSLRSMTLALNRPDFLVNATGCGPEAFAATLSSTDGQSAALSVPYQATGCGSLRFSPAFEATITRDTSDNGAALQTVITQPPGQANLSQAVITLPTSLTVRPTTLAAMCVVPALTPAAATSCPPAATVGRVSAVTPLLPEPLSGPVVLLRDTQFHFGLYLGLGGPLSLPLIGNVGIGAALTTSLSGVPDLPVSRFELNLTGGPSSMFTANANACTSPGLLHADLTAHNGAVVHLSGKPVVTPCAGVAGSLSGASLRVRLSGVRTSHPALQMALRGSRFGGVRFTLPGSLSLRSHARGLSVTINGRRARSSLLRVGSHTLTVRLPRRGATSVVVTVRRPALRLSGTLASHHRRHRITLRFRVRVSPTGRGPAATLTARVRA